MSNLTLKAHLWVPRSLYTRELESLKGCSHWPEPSWSLELVSSSRLLQGVSYKHFSRLIPGPHHAAQPKTLAYVFSGNTGLGFQLAGAVGCKATPLLPATPVASAN